MTDETQPLDPNQTLAERIVAEAVKQNVKAEVTINKIPPNIASNILEFLRRVQLTGMEAIAWGEAYSYMQQFAQGQPAQHQGTPFTGLKR
jgi:hypothetical protein